MDDATLVEFQLVRRGRRPFLAVMRRQHQRRAAREARATACIKAARVRASRPV
ncbi:MAG: hypothetical protein U1F30_10165 [Steroidobacteraceae bacterium]